MANEVKAGQKWQELDGEVHTIVEADRSVWINFANNPPIESRYHIATSSSGEYRVLWEDYFNHMFRQVED